MASKGMSTAGMTLSYIIAAASSIPTTGSAITIPEVKTVPNLNPAPQSIDITPLNEEDNVLYTGGLKDLGGVLEFTANLTDELVTVWNTTLASAIAGMSATSACWFEVKHPKLTQATWFKGEPFAIGMGEAAVNAALETTLYIAPKSAPELGTKL